MKKSLILFALAFVLHFNFPDYFNSSFSDRLNRINEKLTSENFLEEIILPDKCKLLILNINLEDSIGKSIVETLCPQVKIERTFKLIPNQA